MALEPVGISLEAEGFKKYIKNLDDIDKKQRDAFDTEFKGTGKSFAEVTKAAKAYEKELAAVVAAEKKAEKEAEKLAQAQVKAANKAREAQQKQAEEAKRAGRGQVGAGVKDVFSGDITGGVKGIASGLKTIGPAAAIATGGLAAVAAGAVAATAAIGFIGVGAIKVAKDTDTASRDIAASLGISASDAADKYNVSLQNIFVDNPQAQFAKIAEAIALTERALDFDTAGIEQVAGDTLKLQQTFGGDLQKTIGATEQLVERFGLSGQEATDLLTFGLQNIPAEDLIDSVGEFSNVFSNAGFSANEFFSVLASGAAGGVLGTDKAADAVKEFQIRFLEGNKSLTDSFGVLGLNFSQLTQDVSSGQKTIADVFGLVVDRAGQVDLSVAANRAAIAGLGTQFEDLGAAAIAALDTDAIGFEDIAGSADKLNERFNNLGDAFTSIKRGALVALAPIGQTVLELANSIVPKIKAAFDAVKPAIEAFAARIVPAFEFGAAALARLGQTLGGVSSGASTFESILNGLASVIEGVAGGLEILARVAETFRQTLAFARAGAAAFGSIANDVFNAVIESFGAVGRAFKSFVSGDFGAGFAELKKEVLNFEDTFDRAGAAAVDAFKDSIFREADSSPVKIPVEPEISGTAGAGTGATIPDNNLAKPFQLGEEAIKSYQNALKQAEQLQLSFSRAAEDTAIKLARANEDIARKQIQSVANLEEKQKGDREKLLNDQTKQLDKFEADRRKQISKAEGDIQKARKEAADQRKRDQQKLQRELAQAQERFNLSQLQSERRFGLSEQRLRADGDILALQQLREDRDLERQEEKENFDLSKKEQIQSASEQQREQAKDLESRVNELKSNLEDQRAELLKSFDEQLAAQTEAQALAKAEQQRGFDEAAAERQIQLAREEEDRRLSQARQLEDLGRSLAEQEGVTAEGSTAIAGELEKVFGIDGLADNIMTGFTDRTESDFKDLFKDVGKIIGDAEIPSPSSPVQTTGGGGARRSPAGPQRFGEGGIVEGPIGSPQTVIAHGGETFIPTHKSSFAMTAPVIPSQNLSVTMDGGFNITGGGEAGEAATQAAVAEMTENFRIAVQRLARRN